MSPSKFLFVLIALIVRLQSLGQNNIIQPDSDPVDSSNVKWFEDSRFGMFIHWDMSSLAKTEISWSRKGSKPLDITGDPAGYVEDPVYDNLYKKFNPKNFNAEEWVKVAKDAGMKYLVFTAKHHGGFCMWNTKYTNYNIMNTPFKRDVIKELSDACHKAHLKFGIYYSQRDWHNPDYGAGDNKKYVEYMNNELRELLTNYGKIDILWWDSYGNGDLVNFWHINETYDLVKKLQPGIIMNNRLAVLASYDEQPPRYLGDWDTPEQTVGKFQNSRPWESCMSILQCKDGGGWSFRNDCTVKSYQECIRSLTVCATGDGNLLLDIAPNELGEIPKEQSAELLEIGKWLKKYSFTIYNTRGGPYLNGEWGGSTYQGNTIYLHVLQWKNNQLQLPALTSKIIKIINVTDANSKVQFEQKGDELIIKVPADKQDKTDTIIKIELSENAGHEFNHGDPLSILPG